jgi:hypothetical protein
VRVCACDGVCGTQKRIFSFSFFFCELHAELTKAERVCVCELTLTDSSLSATQLLLTNLFLDFCVEKNLHRCRHFVRLFVGLVRNCRHIAVETTFKVGDKNKKKTVEPDVVQNSPL